MIKSRFCPSPTGLVHLGNARTALFNYLFAQKQKGIFLLRIEDTDVKRSKEKFDFELRRDLHWIGIDWQEGPDKEGNKGPYYQSKRQTIYKDYYQRLEAVGQAYPCFCSEEQLESSREFQRLSGKPPRYTSTCRYLSSKEAGKKRAKGLQPALRFRVPDNEVVTFTDLVQGEQHFQTNDIGDFIIRRADGTSPFIFCNAVDDTLMGITHVFRGQDHLTNTPRQLLILRALNLAIPAYGHIALIIDRDGSPLSKRHGSRSIKELREMGYLPEAVTNYLARLGHFYESNTFLSLVELAERFNIESLSKSPAKFNAQQLDYWQKQAIAQFSYDHFLEWVGDGLKSKIPEDKINLFLTTIKPNVSSLKDVHYWINVCFNSAQSFGSTQKAYLQVIGNVYFEKAAEAFKQFDKDLKSVMHYLKKELNLKGQALYQPLRIALTGIERGPELAKLILLMDANTIQERLKR